MSRCLSVNNLLWGLLCSALIGCADHGPYGAIEPQSGARAKSWLSDVSLRTKMRRHRAIMRKIAKLHPKREVTSSQKLSHHYWEAHGMVRLVDQLLDETLIPRPADGVPTNVPTVFFDLQHQLKQAAWNLREAAALKDDARISQRMSELVGTCKSCHEALLSGGS